jgi:hypothetical protein
MRLGRDGTAGLIGLIGLAVSLGLMPFAYGLPKLPIVPIGPGFYPMLVLGFMAFISAILVLQDLLARRPATPAAGKPAGIDGEARQMVLERPASMRQWVTQLAIAVGTSAIAYLVFERYLSVILPRGTWTNW